MPSPSLTATCDVLIVGGGLAATWAAVAAAEAGARVVLVNKGYCGASEVAATAGVGHWVVPPEYAARDQAMRVRARQGGLLTDRNWQERVLDETWRRLPKLAEWGYADAKDARNLPVMRVGQAPHYLRFMRSAHRRNPAAPDSRRRSGRGLDPPRPVGAGPRRRLDGGFLLSQGLVQKVFRSATGSRRKYARPRNVGADARAETSRTAAGILTPPSTTVACIALHRALRPRSRPAPPH